MAAPTVVLQQLASAQTTIGTSAGSTATRAFASVTVAAGDRIAIETRTEDGAYHFTAAAKTAGTATVTTLGRVRSTGTASATCSNELFLGTVTAGGTLTITLTLTNVTGAAQNQPRNGATLMVATGAAATNHFISHTARQMSIMTADNNSWVGTFTTDWTAAASNGASFTPAGMGQVIDVRATDGVDQQASAGLNSSVFCAHWTDTGSRATTTFGLSSPSAGTYNTIAVEFTASNGGGTAFDSGSFDSVFDTGTNISHVPTGAISSSVFQGSSASQAYTSSAFSPPAGSLVVVVAQATQSFNNAWNTPTITDSLGSHLTWTRLDTQADVSFSGANSTVSVFYALCPTAQTGMTVTVTQSVSGSGQTVTFSSIDPLVFTGYDTVPAISLSKGISSATTLSVTATPTSVAGSFLVLCANNAAAASGASTAGSGCYMAAETHVGTSFAVLWYGSSAGPIRTTAAQILAMTGATPRWQYLAIEIAGKSLGQTASVAMAGSSSMSVAGRQDISPAVALAGSSTMSVAGRKDVSASVAMVGSGALAVAARQDVSSAVVMAGAGTMSTAGTVAPSIAMAGSSSMTVTATVSRSLAVAMAGAGTMATAGRLDQSAAVGFAGAGALSVTSTVQRVAAVLMAGAGSVIVSGRQDVSAGVTMGGAGVLSVQAAQSVLAGVLLAGSGAMGVTGRKDVPSIVTLAGAGALTVTVQGQQQASVTMAGAGALAVTTTVDRVASVLMAGGSALAIAARVDHAAAIAFAGAGAMAAGATVQRIAVVSFGGAGTMAVAPGGQFTATVSMVGSGTLGAGAALSHLLGVSMIGASAMAVTAAVTHAAGVGLDGGSTMTIAGTGALLAAIVMAGLGTMGAEPSLGTAVALDLRLTVAEDRLRLEIADARLLAEVAEARMTGWVAEPRLGMDVEDERLVMRA